MSDNKDKIRDTVREGYAKVAKSGGGCCGPAAGCCGGPETDAMKVAESVGYDRAALEALPDGANMGLSCGNPTALAALSPGKFVLDLGAGGGFDGFLAGPAVGATGRVIGVDMTPEMLGKARGNLAAYRARTGLSNVEFRLGEIEHLPVADASVDVVISNCVLNLSPDKPQVWREIFRVLKPGGRAAISDLALLKPLPDAVRASVEALVGCIAGAVTVAETEAFAREAGFAAIRSTPKPGYVESMTAWNDPLYAEIVKQLPKGETPADYVASVNVEAVKPRRACCCG